MCIIKLKLNIVFHKAFIFLIDSSIIYRFMIENFSNSENYFLEI